MLCKTSPIWISDRDRSVSRCDSVGLS